MINILHVCFAISSPVFSNVEEAVKSAEHIYHRLVDDFFDDIRLVRSRLVDLEIPFSKLPEPIIKQAPRKNMSDAAPDGLLSLGSKEKSLFLQQTNDIKDEFILVLDHFSTTNVVDFTIRPIIKYVQEPKLVLKVKNMTEHCHFVKIGSSKYKMLNKQEGLLNVNLNEQENAEVLELCCRKIERNVDVSNEADDDNFTYKCPVIVKYSKNYEASTAVTVPSSSSTDPKKVHRVLPVEKDKKDTLLFSKPSSSTWTKSPLKRKGIQTQIKSKKPRTSNTGENQEQGNLQDFTKMINSDTTKVDCGPDLNALSELFGPTKTDSGVNGSTKQPGQLSLEEKKRLALENEKPTILEPMKPTKSQPMNSMMSTTNKPAAPLSTATNSLFDTGLTKPLSMFPSPPKSTTSDSFNFDNAVATVSPAKNASNFGNFSSSPMNSSTFSIPPPPSSLNPVQRTVTVPIYQAQFLCVYEITIEKTRSHVKYG
uniref:Uncharacterized protein n=1 Tax=Panagrolaimus sp. JU765 TaxID=591449 RepID=A0AC34Q4D6_9BILA